MIRSVYLEVKYVKIHSPLIYLIRIVTFYFSIGMTAVKVDIKHSALYFGPGTVLDRIL